MNISQIFPLPGILRREFAGYGLATFQKDLLAGITVGAVALPLALAFGIASGATPAAGLVTAIISGLVIGGLSGAPYQISGPTGAMSAVLIVVAGRHGIQGVLVVGFLAGFMILLIGIFRLGKVVSLIPRPVITGFTSGIAVIISVGQIDNLLGIKTPAAENTLAKLLGYLQGDLPVAWQSILCGLIVTIAIFLLPKAITRRVPGSLIGLVTATLIAQYFGFSLPVIGDIPQTILLDDRLKIGASMLTSIPGLLVPALSVAALGGIESLLCGAVCANATGKKMDSNQELIAQGLGNMLIPLFGGVPATAAIARSSVGVSSGGQTRVVSIVQGLLMLACVFLLGPIIAHVPLAALAGVLIATAVKMNEWEEIRWMIQHGFRSAIFTFAITMLATAWLDLTQAIIIGMALSTLGFVFRSSTVTVERKEVDLGTLQKLGHAIKSVHPDISVIYVTGPMFFAAAETLRESFAEHSDNRMVILSMRGVALIDLSGLEVIEELWKRQRKQGGELMLAAVQPAVRAVLDRSRLTAEIGEQNFFWSADRAILAANELLMATA
ncbi:MAG: SulP family inorganic anion transporter [Thermoflexales bacterium]|nr:SulP family inorganic anion transporter [Thermoflexales bacterium]MBP8241846.1 SulP family inorganic anion transporter [Thermoflexales bacterium]